MHAESFNRNDAGESWFCRGSSQIAPSIVKRVWKCCVRMKKIFEAFEQVPGTKGGTGLGLAICKAMI